MTKETDLEKDSSKNNNNNSIDSSVRVSDFLHQDKKDDKEENLVPNSIPPKRLTYIKKEKFSYSDKIIVSLIISILGLWFNNNWLGLFGSILALCFSLIQVIPFIQLWIRNFLTPQERQTLIAFIGFLGAIAILSKYLGIYHNIVFG